jgi:hypothetical protein
MASAAAKDDGPEELHPSPCVADGDGSDAVVPLMARDPGRDLGPDLDPPAGDLVAKDPSRRRREGSTRMDPGGPRVKTTKSFGKVGQRDRVWIVLRDASDDRRALGIRDAPCGGLSIGWRVFRRWLECRRLHLIGQG